MKFQLSPTRDWLDVAWPPALFAAGMLCILADLTVGLAGFARLFE